MYYGSETVDRIANEQLTDTAAYAADAGRMLCVHSPDGSTFVHEMTWWPPSWMYDVKSKIWICHSMRSYLKDIPAKFHPDPIWNDRALRFFWRGLSQQKQDEYQYGISSWSKKLFV